MTMRTTFRDRIFLALAIALACVGACSAEAFANTGGVAVPSSPTGPNAAAHTSAIATWFGPGFYGRQTACGQTLTTAIVGVANRTLPCGTLVKVSYKGHLLVVPVLDRGPYGHSGAQWDLTAEAARMLGIEETVRIGTRIVGSAPNTPTLGAPAESATTALTGGAISG
jgi:rare lipoprotein A